MVDALFEGVRDAIVAEGHEEEYCHFLPISTFEIMQFGIRISDNLKINNWKLCAPYNEILAVLKKNPSPEFLHTPPKNCPNNS